MSTVVEETKHLVSHEINCNTCLNIRELFKCLVGLPMTTASIWFSSEIMACLRQYVDYSLPCTDYETTPYKNRVYLCYSNDFRMTIATGTAILPRSLSTTNVPRSQRSGCPFVLLDAASSRFLLRLLMPGEGHSDRWLPTQCFLRLIMSPPMVNSSSPTVNSSSHHRRHTNLACRCLRAKLAHSFANNRNPPSP